jgi:hypothetical protein
MVVPARTNADSWQEKLPENPHIYITSQAFINSREILAALLHPTRPYLEHHTPMMRSIEGKADSLRHHGQADQEKQPTSSLLARIIRASYTAVKPPTPNIF